MAIRSFSLKNNNGVVWNLNDLDSFFTEIKGFGHERSFEVETVDDFYIELGSELKQPEPSGLIRFKDYDTCNRFIKFIQASPLTLSYSMPDINTTYSLVVKVRKFEKKEIIDGNLPCDIEFVGMGQYYKVVEVESATLESTGKVYPYDYPYTYSDNTGGEVTINSDSSLASPTVITIFGPCENPSWSHYANGVLTTTGKVNCVAEAGERLVIDCTKIPFSIKKFDNFMIELEDCYGDSDFSTGRFVCLKNGENKISFLHEGADDLVVVVEGRINYESV